MTTNELEQKLNKLDNRMKFSIREYDKDNVELSDDSSMESGLALVQVYKGEIKVYAKLGGHEIVMAKIMPPHDPLVTWSVDLESQATSYDPDSLKIYMGVLKIINQFLADKENE